MRKAFAISVLLVITTVSSAPAWALALADHSCCPKQTPSATGNPKERAPIPARAHCAAMAAHLGRLQSNGISFTADLAGYVHARHRCTACPLGSITAPKSAAVLATSSSVKATNATPVVLVQVQPYTLQLSILHDERGPPSLL